MTFSRRVPADLRSNRLARAIDRARAAGQPLIDLTASNPTRAGFEYPDDLLSVLADARGLEYEPRPFGMSSAREAVARDYERRHLSVSPDHIALTTSTSESYSLLFKLLANAGDEVLVPRPSYPLFEHLTRLDEIVPKSYDLEYHGSWAIDADSVARAVTGRTRALLLVSPNNPTGSFVTRDEIEALSAICVASNVAIVADEVFADYSLRPGTSASSGRPLEADGPLVFGLGGLSKSVGLPQIKLGWIAAAGPPALLAQAMERLELICDTYLSVSTPVQAAAGRLLERGASIRAQIQARVTANYRQVLEQTRAVPACRVLDAQGGWYAIIQVPSLGSEEDLVVDLVERDGVLTHPGYFFDFPRGSFVIVSLLPPEAVFAEGVARVLRHLTCTMGEP